MKIAIIGAGISGIGAALALKDVADVALLERAERFGGHADTALVERPGAAPVAVDTGFIVYNQRNYPNLCAMFDMLGVPTKWSDMSFGFSLAGGAYEYACDDLDKLFAQRGNLLNLRHLRMLRDVLRFNRSAAAEMDAGALDGLSLGDWIAARGYSEEFRDRFILPMGGAIWSCSTEAMLAFPARGFVAFFRNHDLMTGLDPAQRWRTVDGGSREYVSRAIAALGDRARTGAEVVSARRLAEGGVALRFADGAEERFDHAVFATHADATMRIAEGLDMQEAHLLSSFRFSQNRAVLHSDPALMPKRRKLWSSWNFLSDGPARDMQRPAAVTYWMNRLQSLPEDLPLFVSLNPEDGPDPALIHAERSYEHPLFDARAFRAQEEMDDIQGRGGFWHAGAWLGYGFHEDGLRAGLRVAAALGGRPEWVAHAPAMRGAAPGPLAQAAE